MLHIYSGNGKGKTTAGFGLVLRQAGYERRVAVAQFLKDGTSGELRALQALSCVKVRATQMPQGFYFQMQEQEQLATRQGIQELFAWVKDRAKDMLPIRPQYISRTMTIRLAALRSLVMPVDMPTVPMAEKTSKTTSSITSCGWK